MLPFHPMNIEADRLDYERFVWGLLFSWIPFLLFFGPTLVRARTAASKATGLVAVEGSFSEGFFLLCCVVSVVAMIHAFSKGRALRSIPSPLLIGCAGMTLASLGAYAPLVVLHPAKMVLGTVCQILATATVVCFELAGVILLFHAFPKRDVTRAALSGFSIFCSVLMIAISGGLVWLLCLQLR